MTSVVTTIEEIAESVETALTLVGKYAPAVSLLLSALDDHHVPPEEIMKAIRVLIVAAADQEMAREFPGQGGG